MSTYKVTLKQNNRIMERFKTIIKTSYLNALVNYYKSQGYEIEVKEVN